MTRLSDHFTRKELSDPTTGEVKLAEGFLDTLEVLRVAYDHPMPVNDGCRSEHYNNWLLMRGYKAAPHSFHLIENLKYQTGGCCAVDIKRPGPVNRARLIMLALQQGWAVGIGRTFIHLDRRVDYTNLPSVLFTYEK